ncbi:hypothetical protein ABH926_005152 [Catenulispora sp. GP43]
MVFVYSHVAQVTEDGGRDDTRFNEEHGWRYEERRSQWRLAAGVK